MRPISSVALTSPFSTSLRFWSVIFRWPSLITNRRIGGILKGLLLFLQLEKSQVARPCWSRSRSTFA